LFFYEDEDSPKRRTDRSFSLRQALLRVCRESSKNPLFDLGEFLKKVGFYFYFLYVLKDINVYVRGLASNDLNTQYESCKTIREFLDSSMFYL
jgi:hypothetical protein